MVVVRNLSDILTLFRTIIIIPLLVLTLVNFWSSNAWFPAVLVAIFALLDVLDGYAARSLSQESDIGAKMDMFSDSLGVAVIPIVAILMGKLPVYYVSLSLAKPLFEIAKKYRKLRGKKVEKLPNSNLRQYLGATQMIFLTTSLMPIISSGLTFLISPIILAPSLFQFLKDYAEISGNNFDQLLLI